MAKKKESNINWIGLLLIAVIIYGGNQGWFSSTTSYTYEGDTVTNQDILNQLENPEASTCTIDCVPNPAEVGQPITCTLRDGANANCAIYFTYNGGAWTYLETITTDGGGYYTATRAPANAGIYEFAAICSECVTNKESVSVTTPSGDDGSDGDGADDGGDPYAKVVCNSAWPIPWSQKSCDVRTGCFSSSEYCKFYPAKLNEEARCGCDEIDTCEDVCIDGGHSSGNCADGMSKNPCGTSGTLMMEGNQYCSQWQDFEVCCCY